MNTHVTIVGGGLSGLLCAYRLVNRGIDCKLFEANARLGGRIVSTSTINDECYKPDHPAIDLGPSWFWPDQPRIAALINELDLGEYVFSQTSIGNSVMEYGDGTIVSGQGGASMAGSFRLTGGMYHFVHRLLNEIPTESIITQSQVIQISVEPNGFETVLKNDNDTYSVHSEEVVLALPPRVVMETISFVPALADDTANSLLSVPTWMAGHAKFVALYDEPFWQERGFSGSGFSQLGPLAEIHDASPKAGGPYALFGFVGVPTALRKNQHVEVKNAAVEQLARLFGEKAGRPISVHLKDWAFDPLTATDLDRDSPRAHAPDALNLHTIPSHGIVWAGSETADGYNGYLEGALEAGERAASQLIERCQKKT